MLTGGTLSGSGSAGSVTANNGNVSPGVGGVGVFNTGDLNFTAGSHFNVDLSDTGFDQIVVGGMVDLGNAFLDISSTRSDMGDDVIVLIINNEADFITGRFLNYDEGDEIFIGPLSYVITYIYNAESGDAGGGNDVALVRGFPAPPNELSAIAVSDTEIDLSWTDVATDETGYKIERSADGITNWTQTGTTTDNYYHDESMVEGEGTCRYYRVRATKHGIGNSAFSNVSSATTLLAKPTTFTATIVDGGHAELAWEDHSSLETGYSIQQMVNGVWLEVQTTESGTGMMNLTITDAYESAAQYKFRVLAYFESLVYDYTYSLPSNEVPVTAGTWPKAPSDLLAAEMTDSGIVLTWTNNDDDQTCFIIERSMDQNTWTLVTTTAADVTIFPDSGLTEGVLYYYRARATKGSLDSANITTAASPLLARPTMLEVVSINNSEVQLQWQDISTHNT